MSSAAAADADARLRPVFLLCAGGRTGSTLVQRLLLSTREVLVWGEHGGVLMPAIAQLLIGMNKWLHQEGRGHLELFAQRGWDAFIPNVNPGFEWFMEGARATLIQSLAVPAEQRGYPRWGFKEIRYDGVVARQLKELFPAASIVVVIRHPVAMLRSIKAASWYLKDYGGRPEEFLGRWARIASSLFAALPALGPEHLLRYEELVADPHRALAALARHTGVDPGRFDLAVLQSRHGAAPQPWPLDQRDGAALADPTVLQTAAALGYDLRLPEVPA